MSSRHATPDGTSCASMVSTRLLLAPAEPAALTSHPGHDDHDHDHDHDACSVADA